MKKKILIAAFSLCFLCGGLFADNKAGLNKIGGILGYPTGLSFSHNFTRVDQIDLVVAVYPWAFWWLDLDVALGYLRSVYEPNVNGAVCPLEIGGGISFNPAIGFRGAPFRAGLGLYFDLRWEFFFPSVPKFNLFLDFSPGIKFYFNSNYPVAFYGRGGIGFRANL